MLHIHYTSNIHDEMNANGTKTNTLSRLALAILMSYNSGFRVESCLVLSKAVLVDVEVLATHVVWLGH